MQTPRGYWIHHAAAAAGARSAWCASTAAAGPITALSVSAEECIVAGTHSGALLVFSPDPRRRLTRRAQLAEARPPPGARPSASPSKTLKFDV